jgi:NAD(P)-dependent dehydrogenase (short-subunit alcohol dehydrogenase family)
VNASTETAPDQRPVTVVTGASSGIGAATARLLARRGHHVALIARSAERLSEVAASLAVNGELPHLTLTCDVSARDQVEAAVAAIVERLGVPTGLVNAAGVCTPASLDDMTDDIWSTTLDVNLSGTYQMSRAIASAIRSAGRTGSMVNLGSEASTIGMPHYVAYCASKAGVLGLTRAMAAELAPFIRVNALCPGPVDTPMLRAELALSGDPEKAWADELARVPLRIVATAEEVADAAVWLLTARSATGTSLSLDGGTTAAFYGADNVAP